MQDVELYTTHSCTYCLRVKEFLSERRVDFVEYNVEDDEEARERMVDLSSHTTVPTIVVGDEVVVGFDPKRLAKLLPGKRP
ncbi:glutaredoxin family protein [Dethiobacter alkaliphilus]|uniref:Glutaredoxin n=1 Tax=Dethiobacter alkaliphilus AHT 1 TaxID=555088 RepID=C0GI64_DETAL|nr:glutaredoxin domain-containing protein [Dethiobacter alkaliphilus]EEG76912.1 glutaredoxin [Dethiobacter alkaliphilus AHT 1]